MKRKNTDKPDGRCATCPRWDRWHIRIPNPEDQRKLIELYRKSGARTKSDYVRVRLLNQSLKVITQDESAEPYRKELDNIITKLRQFDLRKHAVKQVSICRSTYLCILFQWDNQKEEPTSKSLGADTSKKTSEGNVST